MAMTAEKLAYHRAYQEAHKQEKAAAYKKWHEANGKDRYYDNLELTRAIKRKCYYKSTGNLEAARAEQDKIDQIRSSYPQKQSGSKRILSADENCRRRKASQRKYRYKGLSGLNGLDEHVDPGVCEICGSTKKICLDHCHESNAFRGWICDDCNTTLGKVNESVETLKAMIAYLEKGARLDQINQP